MSKTLRRRSPVGFMLLTLIAVVALPLTTRAAAESPIAPYVDDATIAVGRVNVVPLDIDGDAAWGREIGKALGEPQQEIDKMVEGSRAAGTMANQWISKFNKAGGKTIYAIVSMGNPPTVRLVVPLEAGADAKVLTEMLTPLVPTSAPTTEPGGGPPPPSNFLDQDLIPGARVEVIGKTLNVAPAKVMQSLKDFTPAPRPELEAAFAACGDSHVAIAANPTEGLRLLAVSAMPKLPQEVGGGSISVLSEGLRWVALTVDFPPGTALHLTVQAKDAAAAAALRGLVDKGLQTFKAKFDPAATDAAKLDKYLDAVTPAVAGSQLRLEIDKEKFQLLAKAVGPALARAEHQAKLVKSQSNLRILALGVTMYANDHQGKLPLDPKEDLKKYDIGGPELWVNPAYPDRKDGYYYIRPAEKLDAIPTPAETPLFYEAFGLWTDGINVAFADGHVEAVKDKAAFAKMLAKAQKH